MRRCRTGKPDTQLPLDPVSRTGRLQRALFDARQNVLRLLQKDLAARCQVHALGVTFEQVKTQLGFQRSDLLTEGRLLHVQSRSGAGKVTLLGDHHEIAQMTKLHGGLSRNEVL
jgi:aerobic C4-dicarboxylate transport protein